MITLEHTSVLYTSPKYYAKSGNKLYRIANFKNAVKDFGINKSFIGKELIGEVKRLTGRTFNGKYTKSTVFILKEIK